MQKGQGGQRTRTGIVMATYLAGILIGGLYLGAVSPVRTVVQADFGIDGTLGLLTAYAAYSRFSSTYLSLQKSIVPEQRG